MTGPPRDWDKELAEIDKIIAKQPLPAAGKPVPAAAAAAGTAVAPRAAAAPAPAPARGRAALSGWVRVLLGAAAAAGVALAWPYAHRCGLPLYGYLAASSGVILAGLWGVVTSWRRRLGVAHVVALLATLTGIALVTRIIVDRTSYPRHPATWSCGP
jgi:hypothetical protein